MTTKLEPGTIYRARGMAWKWVAIEENEDGHNCRRLSKPSQTAVASPHLEILGRLPPDQLDATGWRDEYKLPPTYNPEEHDLYWNPMISGWEHAKAGWLDENPECVKEEGGVIVSRAAVKLSPGMVVTFKSWPERQPERPYLGIDVGTPLVITDFEGDPGTHIRRLDEPDFKWYMGLDLRETDDLEVLGRIPLDQLYTATEIPSVKIQPGMKIKFRSRPRRWGGAGLKVDQTYVVKEKANSTREGALAWRLEGTSWWLSEADDFEIIPPCTTDQGLTLPVGTRFRFRSWPERWGRDPCAAIHESWVVTEDKGFRGSEGDARFSPELDVLPTDDIEILSTPEHGQTLALLWATWCGWDCFDEGTVYAVKAGRRIEAPRRPELLDRIADAEGLRRFEEFTQEVQLKEKFRKERDTERAAREKAEEDYKTELKLRDRYCLALTKAEKALKEGTPANYARVVGERNSVKKAFLAATGQEYEPGKDYSGIERTKRGQSAWKHGYDRGVEDATNPSLKFMFKKKEKTKDMKASELPKGTVFNHPASARYNNTWWVSRGDGTAHDQNNPTKVVDVADAPYILADSTPISPKGDPMSKPRLRKTKWCAKYATIITLASLISPVAVWNHAKDWWTSPTVLELGDWTKIRACDGCDHVTDASICPSCGGEKFSEKKAQTLREPGMFGGHSDDSIRGYKFPDGTEKLAPGIWETPARRVRVDSSGGITILMEKGDK